MKIKVELPDTFPQGLETEFGTSRDKDNEATIITPSRIFCSGKFNLYLSFALKIFDMKYLKENTDMSKHVFICTRFEIDEGAIKVFYLVASGRKTIGNFVGTCTVHPEKLPVDGEFVVASDRDLLMKATKKCYKQAWNRVIKAIEKVPDGVRVTTPESEEK